MAKSNEIMQELQNETETQMHLKKIVELQEKKKKPLVREQEESENDVDDDEKELKEEEEKSRSLFKEMASDIAAAGLPIPPSFLKVQKNNESKLFAISRNIIISENEILWLFTF